LFALLIKDFSGTHFSNDNDVVASVEVFLQGQDKLFYKAGILKPQKRWNKCTEVAGDYVKKSKLVTVVVWCFFIYEAGNFWNNPRTSHTVQLVRRYIDQLSGSNIFRI